jgi:hypothetical protein
MEENERGVEERVGRFNKPSLRVFLSVRGNILGIRRDKISFQTSHFISPNFGEFGGGMEMSDFTYIKIKKLSTMPLSIHIYLFKISKYDL